MVLVPAAFWALDVCGLSGPFEFPFCLLHAPAARMTAASPSASAWFFTLCLLVRSECEMARRVLSSAPGHRFALGQDRCDDRRHQTRDWVDLVDVAVVVTVPGVGRVVVGRPIVVRHVVHV